MEIGLVRVKNEWKINARVTTAAVLRLTIAVQFVISSVRLIKHNLYAGTDNNITRIVRGDE